MDEFLLADDVSDGTASRKVTDGVEVRAQSFYVPERSSDAEGQYFFAYRVRVENVGTETVQLVSRLWIITDGDGQEQRVQGPGVVGEQPVLPPGRSFEYTSFCPLQTPVGSMHGSYQMLRPDGEQFDAEIGAFTLAVPNSVN